MESLTLVQLCVNYCAEVSSLKLRLSFSEFNKLSVDYKVLDGGIIVVRVILGRSHVGLTKNEDKRSKYALMDNSFRTASLKKSQ